MGSGKFNIEDPQKCTEHNFQEGFKKQAPIKLPPHFDVLAGTACNLQENFLQNSPKLMHQVPAQKARSI